MGREHHFDGERSWRCVRAKMKMGRYSGRCSAGWSMATT